MYQGTCRPPILHPSEPSLPEMRDLAASHAAPDARYRVTSVPFRFSSLPHPRSTSCTALRLSSLPIPVCLASAVLVNVSNRYRPRRTSDARFPASWSLPAAPASPPHTVFSRMKSLSDSFVHVGPAKGETTRLSKLGDRVHQTTTGPAARISRGLLPILVRPRGTRMLLLTESNPDVLFDISGLHCFITEYRSTLLLASRKSCRSAAWQPAIEDKWRRHMLISRSRHSTVQP